ncbi:MAG: ThiF family adenylyltransferase [Actinomycetaceae bacterium]|nr:ThiF family adenylyltransferase [Actinomycetaceae bacterium]
MTASAINRYARQIVLPGFGPIHQRALTDAHVSVVGAGGLGSPALLYLAGAGVGHLQIIENDVVALVNLHRQVIHSEAAVGTSKAESAREHLSELNSDISIEICEVMLTADNATEVLAGSDVVLDATDNFAARHCVSVACAELGIPHVWAAVLGYETQLSVFHAGRGPIYEDLYPTPPAPSKQQTCVEAGVLGPVVGMAGAMMATETIKLLTGLGEPLIGTVAFYDFTSGRWDYVPLATRSR